jgi:hypothetical protein
LKFSAFTILRLGALAALALAHPLIHAQSSTDDDPRSCLSRPVRSDGARWSGPGATRVEINNECSIAADIKMCMYYPGFGKWQCRLDTVNAGDTWSQVFMKGADGRVYVDARPKGRYRALPDPQ